MEKPNNDKETKKNDCGECKVDFGNTKTKYIIISISVLFVLAGICILPLLLKGKQTKS